METFRDWLIAQVGRSTAIGALAREVREDKNAILAEDLLAYLLNTKRDRKVHVWRAWREYHAELERDRFKLLSIKGEAFKED